MDAFQHKEVEVRERTRHIPDLIAYCTNPLCMMQYSQAFLACISLGLFPSYTPAFQVTSRDVTLSGPSCCINVWVLVRKRYLSVCHFQHLPIPSSASPSIYILPNLSFPRYVSPLTSAVHPSRLSYPAFVSPCTFLSAFASTYT